MGRIRTIKPEFWANEALSELPEATHMLAAALLNYADDFGYFNANVALVKAACSPIREPSVSIPESFVRLQAVGYLRFGTAPDGRRYGHVVAFEEHQRVSHPTNSKIATLTISWDVDENSPEDFGNPPESFRPEGNREQGKEGKGEERARDPVPRGAVDHGTALTGAESVLAEMQDAWKRDIEGVNVEALQRFIDFVAREINPATKRRDISPSARLSLAKKLAGMGDQDHQAAVVEQSISADHAQLYALKDRPAKHAQESAKRRQDEQRELLGLKSRAIIAGCRAPKVGEDIGDYRVAVERAEVAAKDKAHRESLAKRGPKSAAELLTGTQ